MNIFTAKNASPELEVLQARLRLEATATTKVMDEGK